MGTGKRIDVHVHKGAGAYICGEETALMNSLEGRRGNPRIKPPFPAVSGVFGMPTTINNVETLIAAAPILMNGADWYKENVAVQPEEHWHQALLRVRQHSAARHLRSRDGISVQGIPLRRLRRPDARTEVQGDHSRRRIGSDSDDRGSRSDAHGLRGLRRAGIDARLRRRDRNRRRAIDGDA